MSTWALTITVMGIMKKLQGNAGTTIDYAILSISSLLLLLAAAMLVEAIIAFINPKRPEIMIAGSAA
jgi:hypothetical protein